MLAVVTFLELTSEVRGSHFDYLWKELGKVALDAFLHKYFPLTCLALLLAITN